MRFIHLILLQFIVQATLFGQPHAYQIFNQKGKSVSYEKMKKDLMNADVILFGELHNNPICHWLQLELTRDLYALEDVNLRLGAEMFESDNQLLINEYFLGLISASSFEKESRIWPNYDTDYKPLLEFAKDNSLIFVATNVPRRYASLVYKQGLERLEKLPSYSQLYLPELPIEQPMELSSYASMLEDAEKSGMSEPKQYPQAQMIKDATMAHFIAENYKDGSLFLHFNGAFHSDYKQGIAWYLQQKRPGIKVMNITTAEQMNVEKLEDMSSGKADYTIVVPERMTKTY